MFVTADFVFRQLTFDDHHLDDAIDHFLVWQYCTRVDIAAVDVVSRQRNTQVFEFAAGYHAFFIRRGDLFEFFRGENGVAAQANFTDKNFSAIRYFFNFFFRLLGNGSGWQFNRCLGGFARSWQGRAKITRLWNTAGRYFIR